MSETLKEKINGLKQRALLSYQYEEIIAELVERLHVVHLGVVLVRGEQEVAAAHEAADLSKPFHRIAEADIGGEPVTGLDS